MVEKIRCKEKAARLKEKAHQPTEEFVQLYMGDEAWERMRRFELMLREQYDLNREMRFPFGSAYGWGFRYTHKKLLLLYVFFEEGSFCCTISINDGGAPKVEAMLAELHSEIQNIWKNRYPCGAEGGWLNYSVVSDDVLPDLVRLLSIKVKPRKNGN